MIAKLGLEGTSGVSPEGRGQRAGGLRARLAGSQQWSAAFAPSQPGFNEAQSREG